MDVFTFFNTHHHTTIFRLQENNILANLINKHRYSVLGIELNAIKAFN
ncbi:hypothetical protein OGM63_11640 [Plectonema radiosum NIES-515]|uniref:Uncharacterized protein n=1 Tax=Plectonema radiosum NIES-515 TaxID=2986073 RepID=A0ABT3AYE0_9CYAN|nr:hypothetical protein [Plectonema radiosum]MCV3214154.1 hypothetical protein [Plectonema radiosum NIES-515]